MKTKYFVILIAMISSVTFAQTDNVSVGIIGTHLHNMNGNERLSLADNPFAYGVVIGYKVDNNLSVAFTGEYADNDLRHSLGRETDFRGHLSVYFTPIQSQQAIPYISFGMVYSRKSINYSENEKEDIKDGKLYGKYGIGIDIPVLSRISLNGDLGGYTDGLKVAGWSSSLGLRYIL